MGSATGWIAESEYLSFSMASGPAHVFDLEFTVDLLIDPTTRDVKDVSHVVAAIASSSGRTRAETFRIKVKAPSDCACYGTYDALVNDKNVDIIYIASPHSHHFQHTLECLYAGKHVVCEKPITVNAAQARILYQVAKERNLFLLDAVWTRYFPLSIQIRDIISNGEIGEVLRVIADTSMGEDVDDLWLEQKRRKVNLDLAGGALLETREIYVALRPGADPLLVGIYSITWIFQTMYHTLPVDKRQPPSKIMSHMVKYPKTGVDEDTTFIISFPTTTPINELSRTSHGVGMTAFPLASDPDQRGSAGPTVRIQGTRGEIQVFGMAFQPDRYKVIPLKIGDQSVEIREISCPFPAGGHGMFYEADEAARCVRDGLLESEVMPWKESVLIMEVMDNIRGQCDLRYPESVETTAFER
ncbi:NAD(P)-binding protein [Aureobasidium subglaciale]|nr:NAD(P)-binding protein [Aureobasidium subglaciale]KAI5216197.1 NAD(P)-binding protein [Aureobasidium subglaciale]KAI5219427.1 NAD(P)-binding protein [Aureobasidium subglaciale]KAI5256873.1 NAD(P)-binding protein [Aureobasidium subglaciale]